MSQKKRAIIFVATFLFALLSIIILAKFTSALAAPPIATTEPSELLNPAKQMFTDWGEGKLDILIAKYIFWFLITIVIFAVLSTIDMFHNRGFLNFIVSIVISFLATAYLAPSDIYTILTGYGALGFVLSAIIPFLIMIFFTIRLRERAGVGGILFSKIVWAAFTFFLIWKVFDAMYGLSGTIPAGSIKPWEGWGYLVFIVLSVTWLLGLDRWVINSIRKGELQDLETRYGEVVELAAVKTREDAAATRRATGRGGRGGR